VTDKCSKVTYFMC